jgi:hypothetical protein
MSTTRVKTKTLDEQIDELENELLTGFDMDMKGVSDQSGRTAAEIDRQWHILCAEQRAQQRAQLARPRTKIDTLYPIRDRLAEMDLRNIKTPATPIKEVQMGFQGEVVVLGVANRISPRDWNEPVYVASAAEDCCPLQRGSSICGFAMTLTRYYASWTALTSPG